jgi:hypothetical protein
MDQSNACPCAVSGTSPDCVAMPLCQSLHSVTSQGCPSCPFCAGSRGTTSYKRFKFASCQADTAAAAVNSTDELAAGRIQLELKEVVVTGRKTHSSSVRGAAPSSKGDKWLPEGKNLVHRPWTQGRQGFINTLLAYNGGRCRVCACSQERSTIQMNLGIEPDMGRHFGDGRGCGLVPIDACRPSLQTAGRAFLPSDALCWCR